MENEDMILPEGFDPQGDNSSFFDQTEEQAPTTEQESEATPDVSEAAPVEQAEEPVPIETKPQTIKVKYNHEERELGLDEAAVLAQKGMNYDKLYNRNQELENGRAESEWLAKQLGYESSTEMMAAAKQNFINKQVQELMDEGNTEAMAKFLVEQRMAKAATAAPQTSPAEQPTQQPRPKSSISDERRAELEEFVNAYPGVTKLPDEVIAANRNGTRLLVAYERFKNKAALNELAILKQNQAAAAKAPVSGVTGKSASAKDEADDPFLRGFNSDAW